MRKTLSSRLFLPATILLLVITSSRLPADTGTCGGQDTSLPFVDVATSLFFCQIAEAFFTGLTNGTTATTYTPAANVTREQMAAFITRTLNSGLRRGSRRAALKQWATPGVLRSSAKIPVGSGPHLAESDGADVWVPNFLSNDVKRVRASDGRVLETWTGATSAWGVLITQGRV